MPEYHEQVAVLAASWFVRHLANAAASATWTFPVERPSGPSFDERPSIG